MRFIHAPILLVFLDATEAAFQCTAKELKTIADLDVSKVTSYPIPGDCITKLNADMIFHADSNCDTCTSANLSSEACKVCYAHSATLAVASQATSLLITESTCASMEMAVVSTESCWGTATSLSSCPDSVTNEYPHLSVSEACSSCVGKAFTDNANDCNTPCGKDMANADNKSTCKSCRQAQYLSAAAYCLTVGSTTSAATCTEENLSTIAAIDLSKVSSYPIPGDCIESLIETMTLKTDSLCTTCTQFNPSSEACKLCYASSAFFALSVPADDLKITDSLCSSSEMLVIMTQPCWSSARWLSSCPVTSDSVQSSLSTACVSCVQEAFTDRELDCKTPCDEAAQDVTDKVNYDLCKSCSEAQYLSAATYCLTVSATTSEPTVNGSPAFAGVMMSSLLIFAMTVLGI